jgi:putative phosphoribosyl transferase
MFEDRREAGQMLAARLAEFANRGNVVVLGLPRGGVPVAYEVARALGAPLDAFVVRKLGTPGQEELAFGAIASPGVRVLNLRVINAVGLSARDIEEVTQQEVLELERRERQYRGSRPMSELRGRTVILVDDGLATGSSMRAAVAALKTMEPARIVVAVPVGASDTCQQLRDEGVEVVCALVPESFFAVGQWYRSFPQTSDEEVRELLQQANPTRNSGGDIGSGGDIPHESRSDDSK